MIVMLVLMTFLGGITMQTQEFKSMDACMAAEKKLIAGYKQVTQYESSGPNAPAIWASCVPEG